MLPVFLLISIVDALPKEFHIDCTGWPGEAVTRIHFRYVPINGKRIDTSVEMQPKTTPDDVRYGLKLSLQEAGWRYREIGNGILVLEGSKNSLIRSVEFTSKTWKPDVRVVFLSPNKK